MNFARKKQEEVTPSALWLALTSVPRPTHTVPLPRVDADGKPVGDVVMWPLTQEEQMACNAEADRFAKALLKDPQKKDEANLGYQHTFSNEMAVQVLFRACRDPQGAPDFKRHAFPTPGHMREAFTTDEIGVLFNLYITVQSEVGPIIAHMSDEEYDAMVLRIQEGGSAFPFASLSWEAQTALVRFLVSRLVSCWTDMYSLGLPLDASSRVEEWLRSKAEAEEAGVQASAVEPSKSEEA